MSEVPDPTATTDPQTHNISSDSDEDTPIATYSVYLTPPHSAPFSTLTQSTRASNSSSAQQTKQTHLPTTLLQFPTRPRQYPYNANHGCHIRNLRIKPHTGYVELDLPLNAREHLNRKKSRRWAQAIEHANADGNWQRQSGGSGSAASAGFGVANGFVASGPSGVRGPSKKRRTGDGVADDEMDVDGSGGESGDEGEDLDDDDNDDDDDVPTDDDDKILHTQALAGQLLQREPQGPHLFVGAFRGDNELHLTPLEGIAQMRSQFHHLDATTQMQRYPAQGGAAAGRASGTADTSKDAKPKLLHTTGRAQRQNDGPAPDSAGTKTLLAAAAEEPWSAMRWADEDERESFEFFHDRMFLPATNEDRGEVMASLGKEATTADELKARVGEGEYLDGVSGRVLERRRLWERGRRKGRARVGNAKAKAKGKGKAGVEGAQEVAEGDGAVEGSSDESSALSEVDEAISDHVGVEK